MNMDIKLGLSISVPAFELKRKCSWQCGMQTRFYALLCKKTYVAREHMTAERLKGD